MPEKLLQPANLILLGVLALLAALLLVFLVRFIRRASERQAAEKHAPLLDPASQGQFMMATFQGVIQRLKEQEQELERLHRLEKERADLSQKLGDNITRNMPTGLVTISRAGLITSSNPAAKEIFQLKLLDNMHCRQIVAASEAFGDMIEQCLASGRRFHRVELELTLNNSMRKTLGISVSPIESAKGEVSGAVCLVSDLTELAALQKQVRMKEGLAVLGEMSAGIAHEFKNSLATICGYAQMLRSEDLPASLQDHFNMIWKEATQLAGTVNEFLSFAKPQAVRKRAFELSDLLRECVSEMQLDPRFPQVAFSYDGGAVRYEGDETLLRSAFNNLLLNGAESVSQNGGKGRVACRLETASVPRPHQARIRVWDDGGGISSDDVDKIFIPFFTRKPGGTGLGLALVQKIVLLHDGKIEVTSQPGEGASFEILL